MYFKALKGTETFAKVEKCFNKRREASKVIEQAVKELGGEDWSENNRSVNAIYFKQKVDRQKWKHVGKNWQSLYFPKASNKEALKIINSLKVYGSENFAEAINFKPQFAGLSHVTCPGFHFYKKYVLLEIPTECSYEKPSDVVEILASEYIALKEAVKKSNKEE
jgi:hypothetical protein